MCQWRNGTWFLTSIFTERLGRGMERMDYRKRILGALIFSLGHFKHNKTVLRDFFSTAAREEFCLLCCGIFFKICRYQSQSLVQRGQTWDKWVRRVLPCEEGPWAREFRGEGSGVLTRARGFLLFLKKSS